MIILLTLLEITDSRLLLLHLQGSDGFNCQLWGWRKMGAGSLLNWVLSIDEQKAKLLLPSIPS